MGGYLDFDNTFNTFFESAAIGSFLYILFYFIFYTTGLYKPTPNTEECKPQGNNWLYLSSFVASCISVAYMIKYS